MKVVKALAPAALFAVIFCAGADAEDSKTSGLRSPKAFQRRNFKPRRAIVKPVMVCRRAAS